MASLKDLLVSGAAKLLSTLRVSGDTHIDGTLYLNGAIGGTKQPVYVDSTGKFVAGTSFSNVTNYDLSVAIKEITRTANATTYTLKTIAGATSTVATPVATGTANRLAIYTDAYNIGLSTISFASNTLTVPGAVVPSTTNARTLGTSSLRWSKLYLGTADSYGSAYVPIWWNAGVPTAVTANSMLTNLGSTTGVSVFQLNPRPGVTGTLGVGNGGTGKTSWTQWGVLYASASNTLTNTAAGTTGKYLGAITNGAPTWKDILANEIHPSISKTYTPADSYGTADSDAACSFYFISVKPDSWYKPWLIRFRVRSYCASHTNADSVTWTTLNGRADSMIYHNWNDHYDIGHYYIATHILKSAGFNAGLGHAVGISVRYATGRGNTEYNRTIELDYYDCYGCTVTVLDSATKWSGWTNGTDTNYNGYSNYDAVNRGLRESGDDNSTSISHWYEQYGGFVAGNNIKRYLFVFLQLPSNLNKLITLFETDNAYGTTNKTLLTTEFDPLGLMFHYYSSGNNASASNIDPGRLYSTGVFDLRYTFNVTSSTSDTTFTGVRYTPLYLRVNINPATGGASVDGNLPLVTTLPTAADGKHYIYLGQVHSWYQLYFTAKHPVYYHDGTRICRYYGNSNHLNIMVNGGLEIRGHIAGDSSTTTGHGLYSGGGYHNAYNNIILHGDASTGSSGIAFVSDKVANGKTITNINAPSDRAFIQYHACGVSTYAAEGTAPILATSGEANKLIIGVGNDTDDLIHLLSPSHTGLLHRIGASAYVIPDTNNTSGTVGGTTLPVYVSSGIITAANTYAGGTAVTLNNTSKASSTASFYAPTSGGTLNTQALVGDGATAAPKWVNISPSITITAGTASATPKVNVTVLGLSGTALSITTATTSAYGATKLTNAYTSTDESLAATGKAILAAILTLDVSAVGVAAGTGNRYICLISEADGKISATLATATIGSASLPVWINGGTITALTGTIANNISGNAATATAFSSNATVTLTGDTTGTSAGSTKSWSVLTKTDRISTVGDNRSTATTPNDYSNKIIFLGLKTNSSFGSPSSDSYSYVVGLRGWSDSSGGNSHEFAFNNTGIYRRSGATTTWGNWLKILDSGNYTDYTVTKTGTGASGTWGISITGNAASATKLQTARNISVGDITKSFNGTADISFLTKDMGIKYMDLNPTISKKYESTNYYATSSGSWETSTWYFMSIKPTSWYKPWTVRFKVHTYEPRYVNADSVSYCTISGREQSYVYANWNERYDTAHYYTTIYPLKKAGFDAGYGHAIGISILYGYNYTNSAHYRTFEIDYYDCDNCEVTLLDTPVKWASWTGTGSTNYNGLSSMNAVDRGLQESGDANDTTTISSYYDRITAGANGLMLYSLAMLDSTGNWQSFTTNNGTGTSKTKNTTGFILGDIVYLSTGSNTTNGNIVGYGAVRRYQSLIDYRYSFNCGTGLTANKMVYIVGSLGTDGLFYLADTWWAQTLPTSEDGKLYIPVGIPYPDSGPYRGDFSGWHTPLWYKDGKVIPFYNNAVRLTAVTASSYTNWRPLLWGSSNSSTEGFTPTTVTDRIYSTSIFSVLPSTGTIKATTFNGNLSGNAATATKANYLNLYEARGTTTTLNKAANYVAAGALFHLVASSSTSTTDNGKPPMGDANVLQMNWDNNGGYDAQLAISTSANRMEFRDLISTKKEWREVVTSTPGTATGSATQPVYISTTGVATACTALKDLAYIAKPSSNQTTTFLRGDGTWQAANNYSLPLAANGTRGGVQIGYTTSGKNYAVLLSSEKMYVNVPWENTTYSAGTGLSLSGTTFNHSNSVTAKTAAAQSAKTLTWGGTFTIYEEKYDALGHITGVVSYNMTMPANPNTDTDTKVTQSSSTTSNWRKLLLHYKDDATSTTAVTTSTNLVYAAVDISALASTGTIRANAYKITDNGIITYNTSNGCIEIITS